MPGTFEDEAAKLSGTIYFLTIVLVRNQFAIIH